ncbi:MAG: MFS transporter [Bradyrhizobiaceae bacterium]|nr:MFS transporter [Bradyrhizobiaceae bacterium]
MIQKTRWGIVFLLIGTGIIAAFQVGKAAIAIPALRDDLGLSLFAASVIAGALGALGMLVGLPAGLLMTLFSARRVLITGLVTIGLASVAGGFTESAGVLIAARILEGCGFLCIILSAPRLFRLITAPADNQTVFAFWGSYMPLGSAAMMLIGPLFIQTFGWRSLWLINGALPLAYALVIAAMPIAAPGSQEETRSRIIESLREGFATPGPLLIGVTFAAHTFQYFALSSLFPTLLVERLGLSITAAGLISAGTVIANGVGNLAAGALLRFGVPVWMILLASFIAMGALSFGIFSDALPVAAVAVLAATSLGITGLIPASLFAAAPSISPSPAVLVITLGLITQIGISGQLLGPAALAAFVERYDWSYSPAIFVIVMLAGIALALALRAALRKQR